MRAKREFRNRDQAEVDVLDSLVDNHDGLTVFELRSQAEIGIDDLEDALASLKDDGLIQTETDDRRTRIKPDDRVVPAPGEDDSDESVLERLRDRIGL